MKTVQAYAMPGLRVRPKIAHPNKVEKIVALICAYYGQDLQRVKSRSRKRELLWCRQLAMYFLRREVQITLKDVADMFGGRDHTTAVHSIQVVKDLMFSEESVRKDVGILEELINRKVYLNLEEASFV